MTVVNDIVTSPHSGDTLLRLYFIRHGETKWSLSGRHTGLTDIPLTRHGKDQARAVKRRLNGIDFATVLTSSRQRARETCDLAGLGAAAEIDDDLSEWDYGDYEGRRSTNILGERPDWNLFRDGCPGGESPEQVFDRADRLIARLRKLRGNLALFSHGQFGCAMVARWIGLPVEDGQNFAIGPASVSILSFDPDHVAVPVIALWNAPTVDSPEPGRTVFGEELKPLNRKQVVTT